MSKIKSKEEFKERDEIEEYFGEIKNKSFPTWILFILFITIFLASLGYYYFIIDNPKNILLTAFNKSFNINSNQVNDYQEINYEFNLDTNIITSNKDYIDIANILKEIAFSGIGKIELKNKENIINLNTFYKGDKLLNIDLYSKDNNVYLQSKDLYDKVINFDNVTTNKNNNEYKLDIDNLNLLVNSLKEEIKLILNKSSYQKEYTKVNDNIIKKITLIIDREFKEELYHNLLNNNDFVKSYSKLMKVSKNSVKEDLNKLLDNLDNTKTKLNFYLSVLKNEFIMFEVNDSVEKIIITKEENKYNYKIYNNSIIEFQGYLELIKNNQTYEISYSLDNIEEELNIVINLDISLKNNKELVLIDIKDAINYQDLNNQDINKILNNIENNKTILSLFEDIKSLYQEDTLIDEEPMTA